MSYWAEECFSKIGKHSGNVKVLSLQASSQEKAAFEVDGVCLPGTFSGEKFSSQKEGERYS